jgi:hypothetical protein
MVLIVSRKYKHILPLTSLSREAIRQMFSESANQGQKLSGPITKTAKKFDIGCICSISHAQAPQP